MKLEMLVVMVTLTFLGPTSQLVHQHLNLQSITSTPAHRNDNHTRFHAESLKLSRKPARNTLFKFSIQEYANCTFW